VYNYGTLEKKITVFTELCKCQYLCILYFSYGTEQKDVKKYSGFEII